MPRGIIIIFHGAKREKSYFLICDKVIMFRPLTKTPIKSKLPSIEINFLYELIIHSYLIYEPHQIKCLTPLYNHYGNTLK